MIWRKWSRQLWACTLAWFGICCFIVMVAGCDFFSDEKPQPAPNKIKAPVGTQPKTPAAPPTQPKTAATPPATAPTPVGQPPAPGTPPATPTLPAPATPPPAATPGPAKAPVDSAKAAEQARLADQPSKPVTPAKTAPPAKAAKSEKEDQQAKDKLTIEKLQEMLEAKRTAYTFKGEGMLDPFRPIPAVMAAKAEATPEQRMEELTPLQKMELSQVKLVAVVTGSTVANTKALVEDSTGLGYIVQVGTPMGRRNGKVVAIFADRVEVQESFKNYLGETKSNIAVLKLYPMEEESKRPAPKGTMSVHPSSQGVKK